MCRCSATTARRRRCSGTWGWPSGMVSGIKEAMVMSANAVTVEQPLVSARQVEGVVTLTLNRGERFNPLSSAMIAAVQAELDRIGGDRSVRVVVLAGEGEGFCAPDASTEVLCPARGTGW